jgi:hypothetical protein
MVEMHRILCILEDMGEIGSENGRGIGFFQPLNPRGNSSEVTGLLEKGEPSSDTVVPFFRPDLETRFHRSQEQIKKVEDMPMERKIQLNLYLAERYRDMLQRLAGQRMLKNPKKSVSASKIAAEILTEYLNRLGEKELNYDETSGGKEPE